MLQSTLLSISCGDLGGTSSHQLGKHRTPPPCGDARRVEPKPDSTAFETWMLNSCFGRAEGCRTLGDVAPRVHSVISRLLAAHIHQNGGPREN